MSSRCFALDDSVRSPSEAPYTAAAMPAGPPPTMRVSYSARPGRLQARCSAIARLRSRSRFRRPGATGQSSSPGASGQRYARSSYSGVSQSKVIWLRPRNAASRCTRGPTGVRASWPGTSAARRQYPGTRRCVPPRARPRLRESGPAAAGVILRRPVNDARRFRGPIAAMKGLPKAIGTSPKIWPADRFPIVRSTPSNRLVTSMLPHSTANRARCSPS